jgi:hypothetical protein
MVILIVFSFLAAIGCGVAMLRVQSRHAGIGNSSGQKLFLFEFAALVVPYLVLVAVGALALVVAGISSGTADFLVSLAIAGAIGTPMVCGFYLSLTFVRGGSAALRQVAQPWWWGAVIGAAIPIAGLLALALKAIFGDFPIQAESDNQPFGPMRIGQLAIGLFAAPLLMPLSHLLRERFRGSRSNTSLVRTRER